MKKIYLILGLLFCFSIVSKSTTITIGTGTITNSLTNYPAPYGNYYWGAKHQFLILASELTAAGMTAGNINSLAFNVQTQVSTTLQGFTISMKLTTINSLTNFETGLTTVFSPTNFFETAGLNTHSFLSPFYWDGTSNIVIETCFNNSSYTQNAAVFQSTTAFTSSIWNMQDAMGVCGATTLSNTSTNRPNMVFDWTAASQVPTANFIANPTTTCSGVVSFFDSSDGLPTSWNWDFGDGNTSTLQNPSHTYASSGNYTVSLIACNANGCDTLTNNNMINVNFAPQLPIAASCSPSTLTYCCDFGITNVTFNTINYNSGTGIEGYSDFTCSQTTVYQGQTYLLNIQTSAPTTQNYAAWIDFNNDGIFNNATERVFTATSVQNTSGNITIPGTAVLNTPLRMRISADYDFSTAPMPCADLEFGQAEDYTIIITQNNNPPVTNFNANNTTTCNGTLCFTDLSSNVPTSWLWNFGDGNTSTQQNPCHTYTSDGTYTVSLTAFNANGNDVMTKTNYITVNTAAQVLAPSCTPTTLSYCCGYGITNVNFNTINNVTPDASEGYKDFSCTHQTTISEGAFYPLSITTGTSNAQDTRVWIDFNNDGVFNNTNELILDAPNAYNPSTNFLVPSGAILNTPLRMRISSDVVGTLQNGCTNNDFGQTEDYGVTIIANVLPPSSAFTATPQITCNDTVRFTDITSGSPISWLWYFGDGTTSTLQHPSHFYTSEGTYTVSLVTTNSFGQDSVAVINYIRILCPIMVPTTGIETNTDCDGTLFDSGGPTADYTNNTNGVFTIQPTGASSVVLNFVSFNFENGWDFLTIYDGPTTASPVLGTYTGMMLPPQIVSSGGSITIKQESDVTVTASGFELNWYCNTVGEEEKTIEATQYLIYPNPTKETLNIRNENYSALHINQLKLTNTIGQVVLLDNFSFEESNIKINVNHLPKGLYILSLSGKKGEVIKKINIQ